MSAFARQLDTASLYAAKPKASKPEQGDRIDTDQYRVVLPNARIAVKPTYSAKKKAVNWKFCVWQMLDDDGKTTISSFNMHNRLIIEALEAGLLGESFKLALDAYSQKYLEQIMSSK